jgi:hypothetical protein
MIQKIKCWFGFHELNDVKGMSTDKGGVWRPMRCCKHCRRGGDFL